MKIGYICSDFDIPLFGHEGCSVRIREFTNALVEQGHEVFLLCSELGERTDATVKARIPELAPSGLDRLALGILEEEAVWNEQLERDLRLILHNLWLQGDPDGIIARERPDILYEVYALFGSGGIELGRRYGIPHILEVNAPLCIEQAGYVKFPLHRTAQVLEDEIYRRSDAVVAVSDWLRDFIVERGAKADDVHVIANGVAERLFGDLGSGERVRRELGLEHERIVGFVGTYQPWHDVDGLLDAFADVSSANPDVRLLLVGDGPERRRAEERIAQLGLDGSAILVGPVQHEQIPAYIAAMDIAVAPFKAREDHLYGSPMKLFEYMAAGKASICTAIEQTTDVIEHGRTGWLYAPGDRAALTEALTALLSHPERACAMGAAGREEIMAKYTWRALADGAAAIAEELIQHRKPIAVGA
jgi:glycosyltransferase involved in cell wall biosynthesis